ncbi:aspartate aminotransferase [Porphyromonas crevioricanis JCM 15906]|uniref:Aspartate aminotransferase n=1 Tax=Porphyromonas crevioricanis JCM 15906 TaxID=1305617 RepID=T1CIZ1_9PORP|nr:pyridoxal phosphate-dependent aminotransferase [Porphyromonas crevioricanis]GAD06186.1 aspartate aminotransferase [Porphyromonas crevioricanis JCM 15906]SJZ73123.1 Aspartate/methionine/tyrosine aminotransferase [Porphyromonas crevioricanis]
MNLPISEELIKEQMAKLHIENVAIASIRDLVALVNALEEATQTKFVRMEMGVPGLPAPKVGIEKEIEKLREGVAAVYPNLNGLPELKQEGSRFAKLFLDIEVDARCCVPTVGSMMGGFSSFLVANNTFKNREKGTLFIDPGFNLNKLQCRILQQKFDSFDLYKYRGEKLRGKLRSYLETGQYCTIFYSNPNNPTWQCLTEEELRIIGELATEFDCIVVEDLAYFGMDFRQDYSRPGQPPYQPTVAHYTDHYILTVSGSKAFSYAGQRIGLMIMSNKLFDRQYPDLQPIFGRLHFGDAMISSALYAISAGVTHSAQWALAAILKATNDGTYNYRDATIEYGLKAKEMKQMFLNNGFHIVYDKDGERDIADGFYFTVAYGNMDSEKLLFKMIQYGICAITLRTTGSDRMEAIRICTSLIPKAQFPDLETRLQLLHRSES